MMAATRIIPHGVKICSYTGQVFLAPSPLQQALANFKAQHGCECPPWLNEVVLMRDYTGYVWRKSGIPPSGRRMMLTVKPN